MFIRRQEYSKIISMTRRSYIFHREAKIAKTGRCEGRKPYGFYESEEALIKRIKQLHRKTRSEKRLGPYQIARILNKEGWPTRNAAEW